jgi:hypothetical protein
MSVDIMNRSLARWLVEETALSFEQIAEFCRLHVLEVKFFADSRHVDVPAIDPIQTGFLTLEEINACTQNPELKLRGIVIPSMEDFFKRKKKKTGYTNLATRQVRPQAVAWLLQTYPKLSNAQIRKLTGSTLASIQNMRSQNFKHITIQNPIAAGLCTQRTLNEALLEEEIIEKKVNKKSAIDHQ